MNLVLRRQTSSEHCTIGELYDEQGLFICWTLEDVVREMPHVPVHEWKVKGDTAIPQGRYSITITKSERFQKDLPLLNMVPGFAGIRIHPGNTHEDTEGCILPGEKVAGESIVESRKAFGKLYGIIESALQDGDEVWIDVRNP